MGCSAPGLLDLRPVPVNPKCPGVVLHATFVDNLLTDSFITEAATPAVILGVMATALAAAISLTYGGRWWQAGPLSVVWLGVPLVVGFAAYAKGQWWPVAAHGTASALGLVGALAANYLAEGRQKAFIKQAFRHYLSGDVIEKILRDPKHLQLGGEKRELTIMFTDLAGFSTFSERLGPVELTTLLNDYLSEMTDIIMDEGGTLDKYEGDAIIAFWNAPLEQSDHAVRACRAALRCQRRLAELREAYQQRTGASLRMRVGLNTGEVVVGNMGSHKRFNYTILGDAANLASRLEGANKAFGTETMVSGSTWQLASSEFRGRKLADLRVVGRKTAVPVYELTGFATDAVPAGWETFAAGLTRFRAGDFAGAKEIFEQLPDDPAAQTLCSALYGTVCPSSGLVGWRMGADGEMSLRLFIGGMRGSRPATGAAFEEFGGDTTSLLLVGSHGERLVLDAGTGMHAVAKQLADAGPGEVTMLFSHYHLDHMAGLTMNPLFYQSGWSFQLVGPTFADGGVRDAVTRLLAPPYWPIACGADERTTRIRRSRGRGNLGWTACACEAVRCRIPAGVWPTASTTRTAAPSLVFATDLEWQKRTDADETAFMTLCRDTETGGHAHSSTPISPGPRQEPLPDGGTVAGRMTWRLRSPRACSVCSWDIMPRMRTTRALRALEQQVKKRAARQHAGTGRTMVDGW